MELTVWFGCRPTQLLAERRVSGARLVGGHHGADVRELARLQPGLADGVPHALAVAVAVRQLLRLGCARGRLRAPLGRVTAMRSGRARPRLGAAAAPCMYTRTAGMK